MGAFAAVASIGYAVLAFDTISCIDTTIRKISEAVKWVHVTDSPDRQFKPEHDRNSSSDGEPHDRFWRITLM
jgi:hypothetical protein